jgi:hypothetical protein
MWADMKNTKLGKNVTTCKMDYPPANNTLSPEELDKLFKCLEDI